MIQLFINNDYKKINIPNNAVEFNFKTHNDGKVFGLLRVWLLDALETKLNFFVFRAFRSLGFLPNLILKSHEKSSSRSTSSLFGSCQWYHRIWRSMGRLGRGLPCSWRLFCLWSNGKTLKHSGQWRWHSYERPLDEILPRVKLNKPGLGQPGCQSISRFVGRLANAWLWILPQDHLYFCF